MPIEISNSLYKFKAVHIQRKFVRYSIFGLCSSIPDTSFVFNLFLQTSYRYAFGELRSETLCPHGASAAAPPCRRAPVYDRPIPFTTKIRDAEGLFVTINITFVSTTKHQFIDLTMTGKKNHNFELSLTTIIQYRQCTKT